jgi:tartrate-resistant acid phosphatase type 5
MAAAILIALGARATQLPEINLPAPRGVIRIAVAGDTGDGSAQVAASIAAVHARSPLDAIILTGDNFYPCGPASPDAEAWKKAVLPLTTVGVPILPVLGNHDYCDTSDPLAQVRATGVIPRWTFPGREYAVRTPFADFAMLDTTLVTLGRRTSAPAATEALQKSAKPWQIVVGHHTIVSSGWHGYFPRADVRRMRQLLPELEDAGVDLYICGHDHHVELIRGGSMIYLVSGAGSNPIPPIRLHVRTLFPAEIARERIGFAVIELTATTLTVQFFGAGGKAKSEVFSFPARP